MTGSVPMMAPGAVRIIDPILTNVALGYQNAAFVGDALFPVVPVDVSGGQVIQFGKEAFIKYAARRAPGADAKRIDFGYVGAHYALLTDTIEAKVPREYQRDAAAVAGIDLASRAVRVAMGAIALSKEVDQATLATTAANYPAANVMALTAANNWSSAAGSVVANIEDGKEIIRETCGQYPNVLLLSAVAYRAAKTNAALVARFQYTSHESITPDMMASFFDIEKVVVGRGVTADPNTGVFSDIWGNNAVLAYAPQTPGGLEQPSFGYTYTMRGNPMVEVPYFDNQAKSWIYGVTLERVPLLTGISSGVLIQNVH